MKTIIDVLFVIGLLSTLSLAAFGLFIIINIFKAKRLPMDQSNIINHIRLVWFSVSRPELFASHFEWLKRDELDNIK